MSTLHKFSIRAILEELELLEHQRANQPLAPKKKPKHLRANKAPSKGHHFSGLTSQGRWKRIRSGQHWAWKRQKQRRINQERAGTDHNVNLRNQIDSRRKLYSKLQHGQSRRGMSYLQRSATERVERRLAKLYVGVPASHSLWKSKRADSFRHSLGKRVKV